ncbi:hypothetical protein K2173_002615 [Erythroxylum novogranatense]|uniref:Fibronectin type III-like domain-containing protein n=1 Tax=Erythroxylum novogranatense TaxID=1862640 RepID=A0AAV8SXH7_9ROSI|nr:hypothetical protein K2173_002615 [Erythroxylum novogranatense]
MARLLSSLAFAVIFLVSLTNARHLLFHGDATPTGSNFTHVCDAKRYFNLGLNMKEHAFCDTSLSYEDRAVHLVSHMTLKEKVKQLGNHAQGVPRLGLPMYQWWSEALHGVSNVGPGTFFDNLVPGATSFPSVILTAASFNETLWRTIGEVVSDEARAMYNLGRAGLTYWSPNVNVVRDPRWGRVLETPGEDPYVVGRYAANYVRGLQDVKGTEDCKDLHTRPLKVSSCCKHYAAYDVDNWEGVQRYTFDARVTEQDMVETFLRPFEMCVKEGDVSSVMCSYNRVNGIPTCADPKLLNQTIRQDWNLHGYIVSDCDSIEVMVDGHKWLVDTGEDAVAQTLKAGLDMDCGDFYPKYLEDSVRTGKVREEELDKSLKYLYVVLMRLGFFDGLSQYNNLGKDDVCSKEHIELANEAARQGIVLLKNDDNALPLTKATCKTVVAIGPHAKATNVMLGNYAGVEYQMGCSEILCRNRTFIFDAMEASKNADATIIYVGIDLSIEAESRDRVDLDLPGYQNELIRMVSDAAKGPVVVVVLSAGGVDLSLAKNHPNVKAILWAGYPGEKGGQAIADVLFGKYNPGGRLPLTWYPNDYVSKLPMTSMPLRPVNGYPGRTYKFYDGPVVYPFGYGLSYTKFTYNLVSATRSVDINLSKFQNCYELEYKDDEFVPPCPAVVIDEYLTCDKTFKFQVEVQNVGGMDGSEVIMIYAKPPEPVANTYIKQVIGFKRVFIKAGQSEIVDFELDVKTLQLVDFNAYKVLAHGSHTIVIGDEIVSFPVELNLIGCFT